MRLLNIDQIELDSILVFLIDPVERGNLPPEGRSSIAAKN
jgi:hypothetical protein